jgi:ETFB lysine methyltransferase
MNVVSKYGLTPKEIIISNLKIKLFQTENLDRFLDTIDPDEFYKDERFPYFVNIWPAGIALSQYFIEEFPKSEIKGKTFLELGCGTGIVGIIISFLGGNVVFSDYENDSILLTEANFKENGLTDFNAFTGDWRNFPETQDFDYIIGSDLLYEKRFVEPLMKTAEIYLNKNSGFILSDPDRNHCPNFILQMEKKYSTEQIKETFIEKQKVNIFKVQKTVKS